MSNSQTFLHGSLEQISAEAGHDVAVAANMAFDESRVEDICRNRKFQKLVTAAGFLIGEQGVGDAYMTDKELKFKDVELVNISAREAKPKDYGLMPKKQKAEAEAVKQLVWGATLALESKYRSTTYFGLNDGFAVLRSAGNLIIAHAGQVGYSVGNEWGEKPVNLTEINVNDDFAVIVGDQTYDTRQGMTLSVYKAISDAKAYDSRFESKKEFIKPGINHAGFISHRQSATVITGEKTPRNGFYVVNAHGLEVKISPDQLIKKDFSEAGPNSYYLGFRPAIVLEYPKI